MSRWTSRLIELKGGEARPVALAFAVLGLLVGGHTILETARDAMFLAELPPQQLNVVYVVLAVLSFAVAAESTALARRFGRRNALIATLVAAALAIGVLHALPVTKTTLMALYVTSGLVGAALLPQFWLLTARSFTSAQGRRLFGPIASGGVLGAVAGAGGAAVLLTRLPVASLLVVSAGVFVATAVLLALVDPQAAATPGASAKAAERGDGEERRLPAPQAADAATGRALARRVALLVALSTAALLAGDYLFKSAAARDLAPAELGPFFARYYAVTNAVSLAVQLLVASRVVRRLGVAAAVGVMPLLFLLGGAASVATGGVLLSALALRLVDGGLRHSINRVATELLYLPMPVELRERTKSLVDSVLTRSVQAVVAGVLFALSALDVLSPWLVAALVVAFSAGWLGVAISLRGLYLDLFRRALARGTLDGGADGAEIDLNAAEVLVEAMANPDPDHVVAAMEVLEQRGRVKLIPALVLYHDSEIVLTRALKILGRSSREDWIALGERLLVHPSESIRVAAVRALARRGRDAVLARAADEASGAVQAYAAYHLARRNPDVDLVAEPRIAAILDASEAGQRAQRGLLAAIFDAPDPRAVPLVLELVERGALDGDEVDIMHVARAMEAWPDPRYVAPCVARLARRKGREAMYGALAAQGEAALVALQAVLDDPDAPRRLRVHAPWSIGSHATQAACDDLVSRLETEPDGFVRYKILRGLGHIVATRDVTVDRASIEAYARRALLEHLRLTALRLAVTTPGHASSDAADAGAARALRLLGGLLLSKEEQALERAFRLLKIANRREDIHRVHKAAVSTDRRARSDAGEFLDTLLGARRQWELRLLFRIVVDDLTAAERVARAAPQLAPLLERPVRDRDAALALLIADRDDTVAALASAYALALGGEHRTTVTDARRSRATLDSLLGTSIIPGAVVAE